MKKPEEKDIGKAAHPPAEGSRGELADFGYRRIPAEEKENWVLRHFDSIADKYDGMNTLLSFGLHYVWKRNAVRTLNLRGGEKVLDLCGGTADLAILAARAVGAEGRVVLYDINRAMIVAGRPKVQKAEMSGRIRFVQGNAERIAIPANRFDAAMVGFGIRNLTRMEKGFEEMYRVLKPGGKLMCLEFSTPPFPPFRWLYDFYSFAIMPWVGKVFTGSRAAYTYLPESIRKFPVRDELAEILRGIGFTEVTYRSYTGGIAVVHTGIKK
jgi:demethylmenaquinone methyltransferase / 2-methoxy-6-polyprenyl-1,4-benzoquinol methylase